MNPRDRVYAENEPDGPFRFSDQVVRVFPDMIRRSVPGYDLLLELTPLMVHRAERPDTRIYDLGCSLGAATLAARRAVRAPGVEIVAVDNAAEMVARCREEIAADNSRVPVTVVEGDVCEQPIENASVVVMYFTLQFIEPERRAALLQRIAEGLVPGGVLLLAEKLAVDAEDRRQWLDTHHHDFKRACGYSDLEIARKRQALENVLVPETRQAHHDRLHAAGFGTVVDWFQCLNFAAFAAIR